MARFKGMATGIRTNESLCTCWPFCLPHLPHVWEDDVPRWYNEMGFPMKDVNNWVKERRPIVYPLDADGRRVRLK